MRLFLSSYRFGNYAEALQELVGDESEVAVIANAKDDKTDTERVQSVKELFADFKEIGITPHELDLRKYFSDSTGLDAELSRYGFVWLAGGNTFVLRRALKQSGADKLLVKLVYADEVVYGGESAGAIIATPSLLGVEFGDDPFVVPKGYEDEDVTDGLHFVPYAIVPHYESEWEGQDRMIDVLEEADVPYKTLTDSQVIVALGAEEETLS
jgi:dipeptidase E